MIFYCDDQEQRVVAVRRIVTLRAVVAMKSPTFLSDALSRALPLAVVLQASMPDYDAFDVMRAGESIVPYDVPVVVLSSHAFLLTMLCYENAERWRRMNLHVLLWNDLDQLPALLESFDTSSANNPS